MTLENKPKSTPAEAPKQEPVSQLEKDLAIDKIENKEVQDKVSAYFEQKEELKTNFHEKMGNMREILQKKVETLNKKKAYAEDFINEILQTVLEESWKADLIKSYHDPEGKAYEGGIDEYLHSKIDAKNLNLASWYAKDKKRTWPVRDAMLKKMKDEVNKIPIDVKKEYKRQFVADMTDDYLSKCADLQGYTLLKKEEAESVKMLSFAEWAAQPHLTDIKIEMSPDEAKQYLSEVAGVKERFDQIRAEQNDFPNVLAEFFRAEEKALAALVYDNPKRANEELAKLDRAKKAASQIIVQRRDIEEKLSNANISADLKKEYEALLSIIDGSLDKYVRSKNPDHLKMDFLGKKQELDSKLTPPETSGAPENESEESETQPEEGDKEIKWGLLFEDPKAFFQDLKLQGGILGAIAGFIIARNLDTQIGDMINMFNKKSPEQIEQELKDAADATGLEKKQLEGLKDLKVKKVLKMNEPPSGFSMDEFNKFKQDLMANEADKNGRSNVLSFIAEKKDDWKTAEVEEKTDNEAEPIA